MILISLLISRIGEAPCSGVFDRAQMEESTEVLRRPVWDIPGICPLLLFLPHLHVQQTRESQGNTGLWLVLNVIIIMSFYWSPGAVPFHFHQQWWRRTRGFPQGARAYWCPSGKIWRRICILWAGFCPSHCIPHLLWALSGENTGLWLVKPDHVTAILTSDWLSGMEAAETICKGMGELDGDTCPSSCNCYYGQQAGTTGIWLVNTYHMT